MAPVIGHETAVATRSDGGVKPRVLAPAKPRASRSVRCTPRPRADRADHWEPVNFTRAAGHGARPDQDWSGLSNQAQRRRLFSCLPSRRSRALLRHRFACIPGNCLGPMRPSSCRIPTTGRADEENSLAMNDVLTDVEAAFDAIYLNYPCHKHMQLAIDRIRLHGIKVRGTGQPMRGLLVTGPTRLGQDDRHRENTSPISSRSDAYADGRMPLLYLRLRKKVTVLKLLRAILAKFGDRYARKRDEDELIEQVRNCIERAGVEVIVIDEVSTLRNRSTDNLEVTDQLKNLPRRPHLPGRLRRRGGGEVHVR